MTSPGDDGVVSDPVIARLRAAGSVFAEREAAFIRRHLRNPDDIDRAVAARADGFPLEQAVGAAEFGGVTITVADGVFVPRPRAEAIADVAALEHPDARVVVDLGCGSGALAAVLSTRLPGADVHAVDIDPASVVVARANAWRFSFSVHHGSWWRGLPAALRGRVELAVSYLPHVPSDHVRSIHRDFRAHEPRSTVDGGADGLDHLRAVLADMPDWMAPGGRFVTLVSRNQTDGLPGRIAQSDDHDAIVVFE